jgi:hypothetical protein
MNTIKLVIAVALFLACYQSRMQQADEDKNPKKKRMYFYPSKESKDAIVIQPLTLYPNPANHVVTISLPEKIAPAEKEQFELEIYGRQGVRVVGQKWSGQKIDVSAFPVGSYIVTLKSKKQVFSQKLVVVK